MFAGYTVSINKYWEKLLSQRRIIHMALVCTFIINMQQQDVKPKEFMGCKRLELHNEHLEHLYLLKCRYLILFEQRENLK